MTDFDSIWRTQDEIRTVVNAVLGECIWNLAYEERRSAIVLELTVFLDEDAISNLCCQFVQCLAASVHEVVECPSSVSVSQTVVYSLVRIRYSLRRNSLMSLL